MKGCDILDYKRPLGISFIGYIYILGAILLFLSVILGVTHNTPFSIKFGTHYNQEIFLRSDVPLNVRFGVPFLPETFVMIFIVVFYTIMAYGYLKMKKWGYWIMIVYSILFIIISLKQLSIYNSDTFLINAINSIIVLIYTYKKRYCFNNTITATV
jgi:hypothetical protein